MTETEVKVEVKESLKQMYRPNTQNIVVICFWLVMIIGNVMGTGIPWNEEFVGGTLVSIFAYLIALGLSGMFAGEALGKFFMNRRWNSALNEVIELDTLGGVPIDDLMNDTNPTNTK